MEHVSRMQILCVGLLVAGSVGTSLGQAPAEPGVPVATQWTLDAAGATQRNSIKSVYMMVCPATQKKGTGFLIESGAVVTNEHVVHGCTAANMEAYPSTGGKVLFSDIAVDADRDLAVLRPKERLTGGLALGSETALNLGQSVTTWGYPLIYSGPAPILSVGYAAGFNAAKVKTNSGGVRVVKHIVVNGAFNPGNSGGPVFVSNSNKVIGVVVWKMLILSQTVPTVIEGLKKGGGVRTGGRFSRTFLDGTTRDVTDQEATALVLEEFYSTVQVMIGEAISVSELKDFLAAVPWARSAAEFVPATKSVSAGK
ncbi:MAG: serine protease [Bryobacteraceae bacterium]